MTAYGFWVLLFMVPVGISILQVFILLCVFNFDTPPELFQNKETEKLEKLMKRMYKGKV